jgi:ATP-binding protein involved in chromosome partitioning
MPENEASTILQPAATRVRDPATGRSIWLAGLIHNANLEEGHLSLELKFTDEHTSEARQGIEEGLRLQLRERGFDGKVIISAKGPESVAAPVAAVKKQPGTVPGMNTKAMAPHGGPIQKKAIPGVQHIIAVASGKGGVGKSTVATNLAVALSRQGYGVGLLDLDVYGPSLPTMMNVTSRPMIDADKRILPVMSYGVRCMSMGLLVDEKEAMIWRGPMIMGILRQFIQDVRWQGADYLIVDLPPGTGDAQLSLIQAVDLAGAIIVTTPQKVALADCVRGIAMFEKLNVPLLGVVENMSYYQLPDGTKDHVFGEGGGHRTAVAHGTKILAELPLQTALRTSCDVGLPAALGDDATAQVFADLAAAVAGQLPLAMTDA